MLINVCFLMCARFVCQIIGSDVGSDVGSAVGQLWVNCGSAVGGSLLAHSAYRGCVYTTI